MDVKTRANQIARKYKSRNPFEIVRGLNIILVRGPLDDVRGFYQYFKRNNIIYLDENLSDQEQRFVLAHELGHMFLHKKANAIFMDATTQLNTTQYEMEADLFAIELLLPDDELFDYQESGMEAEQISRITGYSKELIETKIKRCSYVNNY